MKCAKAKFFKGNCWRLHLLNMTKKNKKRSGGRNANREKSKNSVKKKGVSNNSNRESEILEGEKNVKKINKK